MDHLCLTLDPFDAEQVAAWLTANGVATGEIATRYGADGYGVSIYLTDPEGNGLGAPRRRPLIIAPSYRHRRGAQPR